MKENCPENLKSKALTPEVLIVEDDAINFLTMSLYLGKGFKIDHTVKGETAIEMALAKKYDIILMDIGLKGEYTGVDATRGIRKIAGYQNTPIIAVTAYAMSGDKEYFLKEGFTSYLAKPFTKNDLLEVIKEYY